jgi:hypothetical protein
MMIYSPEGRELVSAAADTVEELIPAIQAMIFRNRCRERVLINQVHHQISLIIVQTKELSAYRANMRGITHLVPSRRQWRPDLRNRVRTRAVDDRRKRL